jgi:Contractile injection system tube protein
MIMTAEPTPATRATLTPVSGSDEPIHVHFNPTSLQVSITNTLEEKGRGNQKTQYVSKSSAKLTFDLIFDTTATGGDVRLDTGKVAKLMVPGKRDQQGTPPTIVKFEWGTFTFQGLIESYKETIDFFSSDGIPLRASLNLTLASQEKVFDTLGSGNADRRAEPVVQDLSPTGDRLHDVSRRSGNPAAGRAIAADNGLETLRFASGPIALNPNIKLSPPITFASTDAGGSIGRLIGGSAGLSIGGAAGIAASAGAGLSIGGAAGLSAGVSASAGAFSELHSQRSQSRLNVRLDPSRLLQSPATVSLSNREDATFELGGQVQASAESGFYADVGTKATLRSRIQFS